jgi:hypothetical protein
LAIIPFIEELKLEQFALAACSDKSDNQAVKLDCFNYYNNTNLTTLPATITCQFLKIDFPTSKVTCSHIFPSNQLSFYFSPISFKRNGRKVER